MGVLVGSGALVLATVGVIVGTTGVTVGVGVVVDVGVGVGPAGVGSGVATTGNWNSATKAF